jgi:hypothetical protein
MLRDVLARIRLIGGVDSSGDASCKDGTVITEKPFRSVEPEDIDGVSVCESDGYEGLGKFVNVVFVLSPGVMDVVRSVFIGLPLTT